MGHLRMRGMRSLFWIGLLWAQISAAQTLQSGPFDWSTPQIQAPSSTLTVVAVGDALLHEPLHRQMLRSPEGASSLWTAVLPWIERADVAYANLEGPIAPGTLPGGRSATDPGPIFDGRVYTSYPVFNYHARLAENLAESGFDVVSTANNHALDRGPRGADLTLAALDTAHLAHTGTRSTVALSLTPWSTVTSVNGWRVAWLACTFSTNGIPDPHHQVLNCFEDRATVMQEVQRLAQQPDIDAVIVTPHVGVEYETQPRSDVVRLDQDLIEAGALVVLGSHPHVIQPWAQYRTRDGREGLIVYSLGNFVSGQFQREATRSSVLVQLTLVRGAEGKARIGSVAYLPLRMMRTNGRLSVLPLAPDEETAVERRRFDQMYAHPTKMGNVSAPRLRADFRSTP